MKETSEKCTNGSEKTWRSYFGVFGSASLSFFGIALMYAWDIASGAQYFAFVPDMAWVGQNLMHLGKLPVFLVFVCAARALLPLHERKWLAGVACIAMLFSIALLYSVPVLPEMARNPATMLSAVLSGAGEALFVLFWVELLSCLGPFKTLLYLSSSYFLGSLLGWMVLGLSGLRLAVAFLMMPLLSFFALKKGCAKIPSYELPARMMKTPRFPWKLVLVFGIFDFVFGVVQRTASFSGVPLLLGSLCASAIFLIAACMFSRKFDYTLAYRSPFVFISCGLLIALLPLSTSDVLSNTFVSIGYTLMFLALTVLLCDISYRFGVSAAFLCSIEQLIMFSKMGGHAFSIAVENGKLSAFSDPMAIMVLLVILVTISSITLISDKDFSQWGKSFFGFGGFAVHGGAEDEDSARMASIAETHGLSPREQEVFQLLAQGKSNADIERALCIANGTLKCHVQRIYRKLDIHSRNELFQLLKT